MTYERTKKQADKQRNYYFKYIEDIYTDLKKQKILTVTIFIDMRIKIILHFFRTHCNSFVVAWF